MPRKRKIIVSIANSADGFIARRDGSFDWYHHPHPKGNYGMDVFYQSMDNPLGQETCDMALEFQEKGVSGTAFDTRLKNCVFTRSVPLLPPPAVIPVFIGEGIPLIAPGRCPVPLRLIASKKFTNGVVKRHNAVRN
jgi:hypothetical protein